MDQLGQTVISKLMDNFYSVVVITIILSMISLMDTSRAVLVSKTLYMVQG